MTARVATAEVMSNECGAANAYTRRWKYSIGVLGLDSLVQKSISGREELFILMAALVARLEVLMAFFRCFPLELASFV